MYDTEQLLLSYEKVAECYSSSLYVGVVVIVTFIWLILFSFSKGFLFSIGKLCHYEWYCRLLIQAGMKDMLENVDKFDAVAVALYSKKKTVCFTHFTIPSRMESLLGLETPSSTNLRDQMSMWLDRILDGTVEMKYLGTWPTL